MKNIINEGDGKMDKPFLTPEVRERIHNALDKLLDEAHRGITLSATGLTEEGGARQLAVVAGRFSHIEGVYSILSAAEKTLNQLDNPKARAAAQTLAEFTEGLLQMFHLVDASIKAKEAQSMENVTWN